jgi:O-antigen/teichoic acid export membrane protein
MVRALTIVLFPLLTLLAIVAPVLVPWLLGTAWAPAVVPTQILALGGAATLVIDTTGVVLMASGRSRSMLGFGIGHFMAYAAMVWIVAPHGISAVALAAAGVHTTFIFVSYALMLRNASRKMLACLWRDIAPAGLCAVALALAAVPASIALSAAHTPAFAHLVLVTVAGGAAFLITLRLGFPTSWRELTSTAGSVIPIRRLRIRPQPALAGARSAG